MPLRPGDWLSGRYRVGSPLGAGGAATVFLALEEPSGVERVVKQLHADSPEVLSAFRDEFALLSRLSHPHLVAVLDFGSALIRGEPVHYYVAQRLFGSTLEEHARRAPPSAELLTPVLDALEGLGALHDSGVRHGDFTPRNVMVSEHGRGTLIDLGSAQPLGRATRIGGTEGFLAPELLATGTGDVKADLYAVGKTLARIFELARRPPPERAARLLERLLRSDPRQRPSSVPEVLEVFRRRPRGRAVVGAPIRLLGRAAQLAAFDAWLGRVRRGEAAPRVFQVVGAAGSGTTRLVHELTGRAQLTLPVWRARADDGDGVSRVVASAAGIDAPGSLRELLALVASLKDGPQPQLLVVEDAERLGPEQARLLLALARSLDERGNVSLLVSGRETLPQVHAEQVECTPLTMPELMSWVGAAWPARRLPELLRTTGGLPRRVLEALRESVDEPRSIAAVSALTKLGRNGRRALALLAVSEDELVSLGEGPDAETLAELVESGFVTREGSTLRVDEEARRALAGAPDELARAHAARAKRLEEAAPTVDVLAALIHHRVAAGNVTHAEQTFLEHAAQLTQRPSTVARRLLPLLAQSRRADVLLGGARLLLDAASPREALRVSARAFRLGASAEPSLSLFTESLGRLGHAARAQRLLERALASATTSVALHDRLARTLLARGEYARAEQVAQAALTLPGAAEHDARLHEVLGVAQSYLGQLDAARHSLELARQAVLRSGTAREQCRVIGHVATLAYRAGNIADAIEHYGAALALAEEHDLDDLVATGMLNLATAEQQAGQWGTAYRRYERGASFARAIGRPDTELILDFNRANLQADVGAFERAEEALARLEPRADALGLGALRVGNALLQAELLSFRGDASRVDDALARAAALARSPAALRELLEVELRGADLLLRRGRIEDAERGLARALADVPEAALGDLKLTVQLMAARLAVARREPDALSRLEAVRQAAQGQGLGAFEAGTRTEQFEAAEALGLFDEARTHRERARRAWERVAEGLPREVAEWFWLHPRRRRLNEATRSDIGPDAQAAEAHAYRRLLSLTRRLSSSGSVRQVLDYAVRSGVDLTDAERGFLLLVDETGAARSLSVISSSEPFAPERGPSRSIVRRAFEQEEPVLTTDALQDPRFATHLSVHSLQLKSVLCVPVLSASGALGVLYVDSSLQRGQFSPAHRELLVAFADQVAIALASARLREQLAAQARLLEQRDAELARLRRGRAEGDATPVGGGADVTHRYDYSRLVGRGPAMQRVLERLDRVVASDVGVLLSGESGTGKELVARAIHENGPRAGGPFIAINCAALPEALLESELFGHVRGAFTGADRDKQGLLSAARGGTLFLDEIGELPHSMQAKLLRVLQEREVRPVGALHSEPLDARVLAATHRDLLQESQAGRFREDLYYRLAVVSVELPPLRERLEDLPELAARILERLAQSTNGKPKVLSPEALRKLAQHPFRGNVRELENILTRSFVLGSGPRLRAVDIELSPREAAAPPPGAGRETASREQFRAQERARILQALNQSGWNVSAVSKGLGIPRATLHRKLKRYGLASPGR